MNRLAAMEAFVLVVETGSFSSAARQLNVGQPAVSKVVAQLENRLGVQLLFRSTQGLTPTEAGQSFYEHAKRAIEETEQAEHAARGASASLSGELRISAAPTFARLHIIPKLSGFLAEYPALTMKMFLDDRNVDLIDSGIDVALRMGSLDDSELVARKISSCPRRVVGTATYFERHGEPQVPAHLAAHQAVVYDVRGGGTVWTFRRGAGELSVTVDGRLRMTAAEGVREAVLAGMGLAVASEWMFAPELKLGTVRSVLRDWELPLLDLWAVFPPGRRASAKARAFVAFIETALASAVGAGY
jgi:DNA-binding transcriptional LysR family regulator